MVCENCKATHHSSGLYGEFLSGALRGLKPVSLNVGGKESVWQAIVRTSVAKAASILGPFTVRPPFLRQGKKPCPDEQRRPDRRGCPSGIRVKSCGLTRNRQSLRSVRRKSVGRDLSYSEKRAVKVCATVEAALICGAAKDSVANLFLLRVRAGNLRNRISFHRLLAEGQRNFALTGVAGDL